MEIRKRACLAAAGFITVMLTGATMGATHAAQRGDLVVQAPREDAELRRTVPYDDLNLRLRDDRRILGRRIDVAANNICTSVNKELDNQTACFNLAIMDARPQVRRAIARADLIAQGRPVGPSIAISLLVMGN